MYDKSLMLDVINFKVGSDNIYELKYCYQRIYRIINNRTKEKVQVLNEMLKYHDIDNEQYIEYLKKIKRDFWISRLYVIGFISSLE